MTMITIDNFLKHIEKRRLVDDNRQVRLIASLSVVIAHGNIDDDSAMIQYLYDSGVAKNAIYETILQSYLFLGFPRMIEAGLAFNRVFGDFEDKSEWRQISDEEAADWFDRGQKLCQKVYGKNYEVLKNKFLAVSPDIFRWMVIEGYGKVLSREGLTQIERELGEVAALIYDKRYRQLISHIIGSINVGAKIELITQITDDIEPWIGGDAYQLAGQALNYVRDKYDDAS